MLILNTGVLALLRGRLMASRNARLAGESEVTLAGGAWPSIRAGSKTQPIAVTSDGLLPKKSRGTAFVKLIRKVVTPFPKWNSSSDFFRRDRSRYIHRSRLLSDWPTMSRKAHRYWIKDSTAQWRGRAASPKATLIGLKHYSAFPRKP